MGENENRYLKSRTALDKVLGNLEQVLEDAIRDLDPDTANVLLGTAANEVGRIFMDYGIHGWDNGEEEEDQ